MPNCLNIVVVRSDFRFEAHYNVKFFVRMMMSWIALYANWKHDPYMVFKARRFQESNVPQRFE